MKERLQQRLEELRAEFTAGQQMMATLEAQHAHLKSSLLRNNGAMQVLEYHPEEPDTISQCQTIGYWKKCKPPCSGVAGMNSDAST